MTRPRRIVFVLPSFSVGGLEKQLANLIARRPADISWEIHTITFHPPNSLEVARRFEDAGAINTLIDRQSMSFPRFMLRLVKTMAHIRPTIVSTLLDSSVGAWGRLAAILTGVPIIVQSDRLLTPEGTRVQFLIRPLLDRLTDRFLPNAHAIAERLVHDGVPERKIVVMPNGVDLDVYDPATVGWRGRWGVAESETVLGYLGRFAPLKRVDLLMDALLDVPEAARPDHVVLAGEGPTLAAVREQVASDPWLRDHCRFLGSTDDTPSFLASIDYLVLPTESEGLPNVVLEAMAMAKPIVATRVSDIPRLIDGCGFLATPGDAHSIAQAITEMQLLSPDQRAALGDRARRRIEQEYAIDVAAERFWRAHLELVRDDQKMSRS